MNKVQFDSMAFQEWNGTCGIELERSGRNLAEKSGTDRDLKWDENYSIFVPFFELIWNVSAISDETERNWQPWLALIVAIKTVDLSVNKFYLVMRVPLMCFFTFKFFKKHIWVREDFLFWVDYKFWMVF